jgi:signal recognition particle subunit SRP19
LHRFICFYPAYIDAKKTVKEGRKIPKPLCIENPTYQEIKDVLSVTSLKCEVENKIYPRERSKELLHRGRIRLQIKHEDGTAINPDLATRMQIFKYVATTIPQLKTRIANPKGGGEPVVASSSSQQQGGSGGSKKGKGKKR